MIVPYRPAHTDITSATAKATATASHNHNHSQTDRQKDTRNMWKPLHKWFGSKEEFVLDEGNTKWVSSIKMRDSADR